MRVNRIKEILKERLGNSREGIMRGRCREKRESESENKYIKQIRRKSRPIVTKYIYGEID